MGIPNNARLNACMKWHALSVGSSRSSRQAFSFPGLHCKNWTITLHHSVPVADQVWFIVQSWSYCLYNIFFCEGMLLVVLYNRKDAQEVSYCSSICTWTVMSRYGLWIWVTRTGAQCRQLQMTAVPCEKNLANHSLRWHYGRSQSKPNNQLTSSCSWST
jgi:hypothetical protein